MWPISVNIKVYYKMIRCHFIGKAIHMKFYYCSLRTWLKLFLLNKRENTRTTKHCCKGKRKSRLWSRLTNLFKCISNSSICYDFISLDQWFSKMIRLLSNTHDTRTLLLDVIISAKGRKKVAKYNATHSCKIIKLKIKQNMLPFFYLGCR